MYGSFHYDIDLWTASDTTPCLLASIASSLGKQRIAFANYQTTNYFVSKSIE